MSSATYQLFKQKEGIGHYAKVTVRMEEAPYTLIQVNKLGIYEGYIEAAVKGIRHALNNLTAPERAEKIFVVIDDIFELPAYTSIDDVAYAACFATWQALGDEGTAHPYFEGKSIIFPDSTV